MIRFVNTETRPLRADAERNRKRLLDAAAEVFAERGLEASTAEIARRAGVGQGTVFRRFPTKDDLVAAIVADRLAQITERARSLVADPPPDGAVLAFMAELASMHVRDRGLIEAVNGTRALADPAVHDAHGELLDVLEDVVKVDREAGLVRADLGAFDVPMINLCVGLIADRTRDVAPDYWERVLTILLDGISAKGPATPMPVAPLDREAFTETMASPRRRRG